MRVGSALKMRSATWRPAPFWTNPLVATVAGSTPTRITSGRSACPVSLGAVDWPTLAGVVVHPTRAVTRSTNARDACHRTLSRSTHRIPRPMPFSCPSEIVRWHHDTDRRTGTHHGQSSAATLCRFEREAPYRGAPIRYYGPVTEVAPPGRAGGRAEGNAVSWNAFLSIYFPAMLLALGTGVALPAIQRIAKSFDVSFGLASFVITAFLIGGMVGTLPTGWIIDRFGRRPVMIAGPLLTAAMALLVMTAHTFPELLVYRFLDGWAAQMWLLGRLARISFGAATGQRGRQVTWMYGMDNVGRLSGPLAGGFIAAAWGERSPFAAYAVLALLALIPTIKLAPEVRRPRSERGGSGADQKRSLSIAEIVLP